MSKPKRCVEHGVCLTPGQITSIKEAYALAESKIAALEPYKEKEAIMYSYWLGRHSELQAMLRMIGEVI